MLRALVAALLFANLLFFAWSLGWLDGLGGARSTGDREPERMSQQVRPELVKVLPPSAAGASAAADAASAPAGDAASAPAPIAATASSSEPTLACLEAGPFADALLPAAQKAAREALPNAAFTLAKTTRPAIFMVYMGRYANREALVKKEDELKRRKLNYEEMRESSPLAPGLSLGRFEERAAATRALEQFTQQGIRTARVIEFAPAVTSQLLRIEKADPAQAAQATALKLAALGKGFAACAKS